MLACHMCFASDMHGAIKVFDCSLENNKHQMDVVLVPDHCWFIDPEFIYQLLNSVVSGKVKLMKYTFEYIILDILLLKLLAPAHYL